MSSETISLLNANLLNSGSGDTFRALMGGYFNIADNIELPQYRDPNLNNGNSANFVKSEFVEAGNSSNVITNLQTDTVYTASSPDMLFPSIKGACRAVGNPEMIEDDYQWKQYITDYFSLGVHTDTHTKINIPFSRFRMKYMDFDNYQNYYFCNFEPVYNYHSKKYQNYASRLQDERMLPNYYHLISKYLDYGEPEIVNDYLTLTTTTEAIREEDSTIEPYDLTNIFGKSYTIYPPDYDITSDNLSSRASGEPYIDTLQPTKSYLTGAFVDKNYSQQEAAQYIEINKNIIINSAAQDKILLTATDMYEKMPYMIRINLPFSANEPSTFSNMLIDSKFENLMFMYLKDRFVDKRIVLKPKSFAALSTGMSSSINPESNTSTLFDFEILNDILVRQVDLLEAPLRNLLDRRRSNELNFCLVGDQKNLNVVAQNIGDTYRYNHTIPSLEFVESINDFLTTHGFGFDDLVGSETGTTSTSFSFEDFLNNSQNPRHSEIVAYRIKKVKVSPTSIPSPTIDSVDQSGPAFQNFWFTNARTLLHSTENRDGFTYYDSQVKYGERYNYTLFAYTVTLGYNYSYNNMVYSQQLATSSLSDGNTAHCLQFYKQTGGYGKTLYSVSPDLSAYADEITLDNELFQNSQYTSLNEPYLADFNFDIEPTIKITEIPIFTKTIVVLDNPPQEVEIAPFQRMDNSQIIGFIATKEAPSFSAYPHVLTAADQAGKDHYSNNYSLVPGEVISKLSKSKIGKLQIFRKSTRPKQFNDFSETDMIATLKLDIPNSDYKLSNYVFEDKIDVNRKYYYIFRFINENGMPGQIASMIEAELVSDGGYKYSLFEKYLPADFQVQKDNQVTQQFKKLFEVVPNINQVTIDQSLLDLTDTSYNQMQNIVIGSTDKSIFDKKFKIRLTSKKTGKKIDLNITYNLETLTE